MIGLDRPIKPEWIYKLLNMVNVNDKPSEYNVPFENIATELTGKEGKRKVRTIIFRSFIYSMQNTRAFIQSNPIMELTKSRSLEFMRPIYLAKLIFDYEICRFIIPKFQLYKNKNNKINLKLISKKMIQEYGDRDIVKRSVRSFIKTLTFFNVFYMVDSNTIVQNAPYNISSDQWKHIIMLYGSFYLKSKFIDLNDIDYDLFFYLSGDSTFQDTIKENHGEVWEYVRDHSRNFLIMR
jgi:hypothetical protein